MNPRSEYKDKIRQKVELFTGGVFVTFHLDFSLAIITNESSNFLLCLQSLSYWTDSNSNSHLQSGKYLIRFVHSSPSFPLSPSFFAPSRCNFFLWVLFIKRYVFRGAALLLSLSPTQRMLYRRLLLLLAENFPNLPLGVLIYYRVFVPRLCFPAFSLLQRWAIFLLLSKGISVGLSLTCVAWSGSATNCRRIVRERIKQVIYLIASSSLVYMADEINAVEPRFTAFCLLLLSAVQFLHSFSKFRFFERFFDFEPGRLGFLPAGNLWFYARCKTKLAPYFKKSNVGMSMSHPFEITEKKHKCFQVQTSMLVFRNGIACQSHIRFRSIVGNFAKSSSSVYSISMPIYAGRIVGNVFCPLNFMSFSNSSSARKLLFQ